MRFLYLILLLFFVGCSSNINQDIIVESEEIQEEKKILKNIFQCSDECTSNSCNNKKEFLICKNSSEGCMAFENQGITIGECEVECISNLDCNGEEVCFENKCGDKTKEYFSYLIENKEVSFSFNEKEMREYFYLKVNELRYTQGEKEIEVSSTIEKQSRLCAEEDFWFECEIEYNQAGVNWLIPWYSNVEGCGFAATSKSNIDCLFSSLEEDTDSETRIYEDLLNKNKIGLGIIDKGGEISYSITLE